MPNIAPVKPPTYRIDIALALFGVAVALLIGELATRLLRPIPLANAPVWDGFDGQLREGLFVSDPLLGYRPGPAWAPAGRFGFRNGAEYDGTAEPATDIVVLGDSLIQDGAFGEALKALLAETKVRVWIAGIGGYDTLQEAGYLEHYVTLDPDVLVLGFCLNDFARSMVVVPTGGDSERFATPTFEPVGAVNPFLFRHSALYRLAQSAWFARGMREQFSPQGVRQNRRHVRRGLETMRRYARRRHVPFLVVLYPHLLEVALPWQEEAHRLALRLFANLRLPYVDLTADYAAVGPATLRIRSDDVVHPNREGHAIAARKLLSTFPGAFPPRPQPGAGSRDDSRATTARQPVGSTMSGASSGTTSARRWPRRSS